MSRVCFVLSFAMAVLLAGCFSSTIKQVVVRDGLVMDRQGVTLRYQSYYDDLPRAIGDDWVPHRYRHVAENRSAVAVCVHLDLLLERGGEPFFTTHVILQPGQKRTLSNLHWRDLLGPGATYFHSAKLEGAGCKESYGWSLA